MSDGRVRLFVALELPDQVRDALVRWRSQLAPATGDELRGVAADALHVTLCFLGWQPEDQAEAIATACGVVAAESAPRFSLADAVWLPRRRPRVLAVELGDPEGRAARIQASLSTALAAGGWYEPEQRPYLAHVTVARVARAGRVRAVGLPATPRVEFSAPRVVLYRSRLYRSGARYEALAGVELAEAG